MAASLDLGLEAVPCLLCLSLVSDALEAGYGPAISGALLRITRDLWAGGLEEPVLGEVRRARAVGVPHADAALAELESSGANTRTARAIVRRLAEDLRRHARAERRLTELARQRMLVAPPDWN